MLFFDANVLCMIWCGNPPNLNTIEPCWWWMKRRTTRKGCLRSKRVDAICINQEDKIEKGMQVRYMSEIYSKASHVIVWLGEAENDSDRALYIS